MTNDFQGNEQVSRMRILPEAANKSRRAKFVDRLASVDEDQLDQLGIAIKE